MAVEQLPTLAAPSPDALLGTDQIGRDVFSRLVYGTRLALFVGIVSALIIVAIGLPVGLFSLYIFGPGGAILSNRVLMFLLSPFSALLALAVVSALGASIFNVIIAVSVGLVPGAALSIRREAMSIYAQAPRDMGVPGWSTMIRHLFPFCIARTITYVGWAILLGELLNFLGIGIPPSVPVWGTMAALHRAVVENWWLLVAPLLAIVLSVLAFNRLGRGLREVLAPESRAI